MNAEQRGPRTAPKGTVKHQPQLGPTTACRPVRTLHKAALVALLTNHEMVSCAKVSSAADVLRAELSQMKFHALIERAVAVGVSERDLDEAEDAKDHKGAVIKLIMASPHLPILSPGLMRRTDSVASSSDGCDVESRRGSVVRGSG
eukprot:COSAG02_NODE_112_length_35994_cov_12.152695_1_plen_146_part_00